MLVYYLYIIVGILILPGIIYGIYAQANTTNTFNSLKNVSSASNKTAKDVAREMLDMAGLQNVEIKQIKGNLTDNYDPKKKILSLSEATYNSTSVAAIGVAAHEVGHAIQHKDGYSPLVVRNKLVPFVNFANILFWPLFIVGVILTSIVTISPTAGQIIIWIAVALYGSSTIFYLVTLPVEYNASKRAIETLKTMNVLAPEEIPLADKVLKAAAQTYVASLVISALYFLRFFLYIFMIFGRNSRD